MAVCSGVRALPTHSIPLYEASIAWSMSRMSACDDVHHKMRGIYPSNAILLRQTISRHLRRSRLETVPAASPSRRGVQTWCDLFVAPCALNVFPREGACPLGKAPVLAGAGWEGETTLGAGGCNTLRLRFFRACGLASASISFSSQRRNTRIDS
jgi:hypothetical protein